jgi:hypothetical protein
VHVPFARKEAQREAAMILSTYVRDSDYSCVYTFRINIHLYESVYSSLLRTTYIRQLIEFFSAFRFSTSSQHKLKMTTMDLYVHTSRARETKLKSCWLVATLVYNFKPIQASEEAKVVVSEVQYP